VALREKKKRAPGSEKTRRLVQRGEECDRLRKNRGGGGFLKRRRGLNGITKCRREGLPRDLGKKKAGGRKKSRGTFEKDLHRERPEWKKLYRRPASLRGG